MPITTRIALAGLLLAFAGAPALVAEEGEAPAAGHENAAKAPVISGKVVSATAEEVVVKVMDKKAKTEEDKTFKITETTEVMIDGEKGAAADLKADTMVKVTADGETATKIETVKAKEPKAKKPKTEGAAEAH